MDEKTINVIFNIIDEMEDDLKKEWNHELDRWKYGNGTRAEAEYCMDIIEGKTVILEQLKENITKTHNQIVSFITLTK